MGQTALITGASSGIGEAFAHVLAGRRHDLVLIARDAHTLGGVGDAIRRTHKVRVHCLAADLSTAEGPVSVYDDVRRHGFAPDVLINSAGVGDLGSFAGSDWSRQEEMVRLNILGLAHVCRLFIPGMLSRGHGRILNVASMAAFQPGPLMAVYFAGKAFVLSFSQALAQELRGKGVTVTCLCPGPTATAFQERARMGHVNMNAWFGLAQPLAVAEYGYRAMLKARMVAIPGGLNKALALAARVLPRPLLAKAVRLMHSPSGNTCQPVPAGRPS